VNIRFTLLQASIIHANPELCRILRIQQFRQVLRLSRPQLETLKAWAQYLHDHNDNRFREQSQNGYLRISAGSILNKVNAALALFR
jgi:hypothetical protein